MTPRDSASMHRIRFALWLVATFTFSPSSAQAETQPAEPAPASRSLSPPPSAANEQDRDPTPHASSASRALALGAAIVPGALVHGAGSYLLERPETARKLLLMEAVGVGLAGAGGATLVLTGAARGLAGLSVATVALGGSAFLISWFADLYSVVSPEGGWGQGPTLLPAVETELGYAHVVDPRFGYRHFEVTRVSAQAGRWRLAPSSWASPDDNNARWRILGGYRFLGPSTTEPTQDGSFLEIEAALTEHRFPSERFGLTTAEWFLRGRLDLVRLDRTLAGSFAELGVGSAMQVMRFDIAGAENTASALLLQRFAFGAYVGDQRHGGGEWSFFYDHRHDGYAGGLLMPGLGSGAAGHLGIEGLHYFDEHWGIGLGSSFGSAAVFELSARFRQWASR